jgi:hypothetical protein
MGKNQLRWVSSQPRALNLIVRSRMLWRAVFAFLALPGIVAFVAPPTIVSDQLSLLRLGPLGTLVLLPGVFVLVWCVVEFYVSARGTLAPWAPPPTILLWQVRTDSREIPCTLASCLS